VYSFNISQAIFKVMAIIIAKAKNQMNGYVIKEIGQ
jgi:hypothetical protein